MPINLGPIRLALKVIEDAVDKCPRLDRRGKRDSGTALRASIVIEHDRVLARVPVYSVKGEKVVVIEGQGGSVEAAVEDLVRAIGEH